MEKEKPLKIPIVKFISVPDCPDKTYPYSETIGSVLYLTTKTRIDMTFAVNYESRAMKNPNEQDVMNVKRTLQYLKGTTNDGIFYSSQKQELHLEAYSDSDYAGDLATRKSTTGFAIMYAGGPIAWCSRKQSSVALSTTEAEYIWLQHIAVRK